MPESANPVQQPQTIIEIRPYRGAGSVLKGWALGRTGLERVRKRMLSVMRKRARNLDAEKFGCLIKTDHWNPWLTSIKTTDELADRSIWLDPP